MGNDKVQALGKAKPVEKNSTNSGPSGFVSFASIADALKDAPNSKRGKEKAGFNVSPSELPAMWDLIVKMNKTKSEGAIHKQLVASGAFTNGAATFSKLFKEYKVANNIPLRTRKANGSKNVPAVQ